MEFQHNNDTLTFFQIKSLTARPHQQQEGGGLSREANV
jgi:hypothetical protein